MARHKIDTPEGRAESEKFKRTMREHYGENWHDFFKKIGRKGGENGHTGGFASNIEKARKAGALGGMRSRRGLKFIKEEDGFFVYEDEYGGIVKYEKPNKD